MAGAGRNCLHLVKPTERERSREEKGERARERESERGGEEKSKRKVTERKGEK